MKSDAPCPLIQNNQFSNYPIIIPGFVKYVILVILTCLVISEVINFIMLRGFENPLGFCLFKLIAYTMGLLFLKFSDSSMIYVLNNLKVLNEEIVSKLEEIASQNRAKEEDKEE